MRRIIMSVLTTAAIGLSTAAQGFDLQGHRGARGLAPENTLGGFARTLGIGVATLELDLAVTADDVVVVIHNPHLEPEIVRGPDGAWLAATGPAVRRLRLDRLKTYDVGRLQPGSRYADRYPDQQPDDGARVPTLAEVFDLVRRVGNTRVRFNIETKIRPSAPSLYPDPKAYVSAVLDVVREHRMLDRVTIQSFDWRTLVETQRQAPSVPTAYLSAQQSWLDNIQAGQPGTSPWTAGFDVDAHQGSLPDLVAAAGRRIWSPYHRDVAAATIARAHDLGLLVTVWTVNDKDRMNELMEMGVDGIITDYPDRLRAVMEQRGMPTPAPTPVTP